MSEEKRLGKQTPTVSIRLPYTESLGTEAVEFYNRSGRTAQDWQSLLLEDIMATNADGKHRRGAARTHSGGGGSDRAICSRSDRPEQPQCAY